MYNDQQNAQYWNIHTVQVLIVCGWGQITEIYDKENRSKY